MALKSNTGLFSMEPFHTKAPVAGMASGFCACACGCACACSAWGYHCNGVGNCNCTCSSGPEPGGCDGKKC